MNTLTSRAPAGLTMPERPDLYWDGQFGTGGVVGWQPRTAITLSTAQARKELRSLLDSPRTSTNTLAAMSAMDAWGTFSGHHLALMTGSKANLRESSKALDTLLRLGILDLGAPHVLYPRRSPTRYFRRRMDGPLGRLASVMEPYENGLVRGASTTWGIPSGHDRHDLLALEFSMRVAEYHPDVVQVLGEKHAKAGILQDPRKEGRWHHRGDGLLVRDDDVRFVVELTANRTENLHHKVDRWARWLQANPVESTGAVVLWVCTPDPRTGRGMTASMMKRLLAKVLFAYPGAAKGQPAGRMAVVDWPRWFPAPGEYSEDFSTMSGWMLGSYRRWREVPLSQISWPVDEVDRAATPRLGHGPHWLG